MKDTWSQFDIVDYEPGHRQAFRALNLEWLDHYGLTESHDLQILDDPEGTVLKPGGFIWMATCDGEFVGTAGLMKEREGVYELIKMAVTEKYRGRGISRLLLDRCLQKAREIGASKLSLFSNHQLETAIALYRKYGFRHVPVENSPMETADVRMELVL